jgi:hypothetical protein
MKLSQKDKKIMIIANEMGYFPTPEQSKKITKMLAQEYCKNSVKSIEYSKTSGYPCVTMFFKDVAQKEFVKLAQKIIETVMKPKDKKSENEFKIAFNSLKFSFEKHLELTKVALIG